jgi:D-tyrosyl-tRNA(Tyr) deacylase
VRALIQRVREASVRIDGGTVASIGKGYLILLGVRRGDDRPQAEALAERCSTLRVFEDETGKMNLALDDVGGEVLVVSQFTLTADTSRGNRPGFSTAAPPAEAEPLYAAFVRRMQERLGAGRVRTGVFQAMMDVALVNAGPVTILLESPSEQRV